VIDRLAARRADLRAKSAPLLLAERARATPTTVAYRAKKLGLYRERTFRDYAALVGRLAAGLAELGLERGERVAIMGDPCEEWLISDLAAQALGAITYGVYPTASVAEVEYQMADGGAAIFVAEDQEYVDKILPIADRLPALRWIVVVDTRAMFAYDHPKLKRYRDLLAAGPAADEAAIARLEAEARKLSPDDPAFIVYTSGTTGPPKGALAAHGRHLAGAYSFVEHYPALAEPQRVVVYLPLSHVFGRDIAVTLPLVSGVVPHFGEDIEDLAATFFEVAPTALFAVPRYLQKFASSALVALHNSSPLKRRVYEAAMRAGRRHARRRWDGKAGGFGAACYALARAAVFRPLLGKLGFDQVTLAISGGAPLPPETMALWQIWGVNLVEVYGQTEEAGAIISGQRGPFPEPGNVGTVAAGWEMQLDPGSAAGETAAGEILVRGDCRFEGYWGSAEATREVLDADGWIHTGDVGRWVDVGKGTAGERPPPQLRLIDRARDFIVTAGGKTLSPAYIEGVLRSSPYVSEAIVIGHARKYLTALIEIDFDTVADWARARNVAYAGFTHLARHPEIENLIRAELERANAQLARVEQVKAFRILPKLLDPEEEGEPVTPTRKVKRQQMHDRFRELVESMYSDAEERLLAREAGEVLERA
jgi:long-chain acyl-CoA synthetase